MLSYLGMDIERRLHSGIDDCHNTSRILHKMIKDGYNPINAKINKLVN